MQEYAPNAAKSVPAPEEAKRRKHLAIVSEINKIGIINKRLAGLLTRMRSQNIEEKKVPAPLEADLALTQFLATGAERVIELIEETHTIINELENDLF